jgi:isopenicillin N synthase-like dioxygenase
MPKALLEQIPSLDLNDFTSGIESRKLLFVKQLGDAFNNIGFVALKNHGLSDEQTKELYDTVKAFFDLPEEVKSKYEKPELFGQRGYIGKGKEHAKGRSTGDLKEFYHVGQELPEGVNINEEYPDNLWPEELTSLASVTTEAYKTLENAGIQVLRAIAIYLDLEEDYFEDKVKYGNSILRPIHYFPIDDPDSIPSDAVRAAEHGDINLITLLMGASADGLQVLRRDQKWIPITALPDQVVVNVGDMLARLTNDKLKSTIHRVVNPPRELMGTSRFSIPFFMHPRSEMLLNCLEGCIDEQHPKAHEDISAGDFLHQRLVEIGLKK